MCGDEQRLEWPCLNFVGSWQRDLMFSCETSMLTPGTKLGLVLPIWSCLLPSHQKFASQGSRDPLESAWWGISEALQARCIIFKMEKKSFLWAGQITRRVLLSLTQTDSESNSNRHQICQGQQVLWSPVVVPHLLCNLAVSACHPKERLCPAWWESNTNSENNSGDFHQAQASVFN